MKQAILTLHYGGVAVLRSSRVRVARLLRIVVPVPVPMASVRGISVMRNRNQSESVRISQNQSEFSESV